MLSRYDVAASLRWRSSRSTAAPRRARSRIWRDRLAGCGSTSAIAAASSASTVTCTRGWEDGIRPSVPWRWYTAVGQRLPGGVGEQGCLWSQLAHDGDGKGVRGGAAASGDGEEGH